MTHEQALELNSRLMTAGFVIHPETRSYLWIGVEGIEKVEFYQAYRYIEESKEFSCSKNDGARMPIDLVKKAFWIHPMKEEILIKE